MEARFMRFSEEEISQLIKAWAAISLAFTLARLSNIGAGFGSMNMMLELFLVSVFTVGLAFLLHELAHKFVAQRYGCWAEFRSFDMGLLLAVLMSLTGFIFAAPGAVMISGVVSTSERGKIAAAGPITNIILAALYWAISAFVPMTGLLGILVLQGMTINAWLSIFNLIPFWNLDGLKIVQWNMGVWALLMVTSIALFMV
ncbi:hypothetical protein KC573_02155 [candidate division WWE3 bacterium]|uniref:Metalloprotease n=1 Tax=candidate division WWE3 bacterium TaxID=2053526 RepID=A0A955LVV4_UNCKA|nr:hypothetical protein [candidate division WWE3 bacterium]